VAAGFVACLMLATVVAITMSDEGSQSAVSASPPATIALQSVATTTTPMINPAPPTPAIAAPPPVFAAISPPPPLQAPVVQAPPQKQCDLSPSQRKFYVAGNGVIRIFAGEYVSQPVTLGPYPQTVAFPAARPAPGTEVVQTIVVEGNASTVVMTSDLPGFRRVLTGLRGTSSFNAKWQSLGNC
jgi:hypothetical protein